MGLFSSVAKLAGGGSMIGLSSAASMAGSIYSANKSASSAKKINAANINWEQAKATHAYQWLKEDLQNAGYNQALAFQNGSATPQAGSLQGLKMPDTSGYSNAGKILMQNVTNALNYTQDLKRIENETANTTAEVANKNADTINKIKEGKWIDPVNQKKIKIAEENIINQATNTAKQIAETDKTKEETEQIKKGFMGKVIGTDPTRTEAVLNTIPLIGGMGTLGIIGKGYKAYKAMRTAKNFGKFVSSIGK